MSERVWTTEMMTEVFNMLPNIEIDGKCVGFFNQPCAWNGRPSYGKKIMNKMQYTLYLITKIRGERQEYKIATDIAGQAVKSVTEKYKKINAMSSQQPLPNHC